MARIRVIGGVADLRDDLAAIPPKTRIYLRRIGSFNARNGNRLAQRYARQGAGPHGKDYWKRMTHEQTGPLTWEYGPEGVPKTDFVGVGFRHGTNTDLPRSADVQGVRMASDVRKMVDGLFW